MIRALARAFCRLRRRARSTTRLTRFAPSLPALHPLCRLRRRARSTTRLTRFAPSLPALLAGCHHAPLDHEVHATQVEHHTVPTADGAAVALHRYAAAGPPVLIAHGISSNHRCWDLTPERSIGLYLADRGVDAWLLDLRGHGEATRDARDRPQRSGWLVDDYGRYDLPAAVDFVRERTGYDRIAYAGHSMGGMVGAIYAGTVHGAADRLSALIAVASPMDFSDPDPLIGVALRAGAVTGPILPVLRSDQGAWLVGGAPNTPLPVDEMLFNDLADPEMRKLMYRRVVSPMSGGELRQFGTLTEREVFSSRSGAYDYLEALERVQTPTLVFAGRADYIAPVDRVVPYYDRVGAEEKRLVIAGRVEGFAADYGHMDFTLGDHAREEIFPLILDWVVEHADPAPSGSSGVAP